MGDDYRIQMSNLNARIPTSVRTRDRLRALKHDADTYDDVLQRLLERHDNYLEPSAETA